MIIRIFLFILLFSNLFSQYLLKEGKIINTQLNIIYSDNEFINLINNTNYYNNEKFIKYEKHHNKLKFKKAWPIYLLSIGSIGAGIDGIRNPEEFIDDKDPPGWDNIVFGCILSSTYYAYNDIKKKRALYSFVKEYNLNNITIDTLNHTKSYSSLSKISNINNWSGSGSYGFLSEKIPWSFIDFSAIYNINKKSEYYGTFSYVVFGAGLALGYKYYLNDKFKPSFFISSSLIAFGGGDEWQNFTGINLAPGFSLILNKQSSKNNFLYDKKIKRKTINFGVSFQYISGQSSPPFPFPYICYETIF